MLGKASEDRCANGGRAEGRTQSSASRHLIALISATWELNTIALNHQTTRSEDVNDDDKVNNSRDKVNNSRNQEAKIGEFGIWNVKFDNQMHERPLRGIHRLFV